MSEAYQDSLTLRDVSSGPDRKTSAAARRNDVPRPTMWQETVVPIPPATHRISSACSGYRIIAFPGLLDVPKMAMVSQLWHFS